MSLEPAPPARFPWPPALVVLTLAAGYALGPLAPDWPLPRTASYIVGAALAFCALGIDFWCAALFRRKSTTLKPHGAPSALVVDGPYRFSRNPIYVAHVALVIAIGFLTRASGVVLLAPFLVVALDLLSAAPEEKWLAAKFGAEFDAFAARTRRWL
jgi:protein-S-isoprenylcysteine O-methyltransferase Ste14